MTPTELKMIADRFNTQPTSDPYRGYDLAEMGQLMFGDYVMLNTSKHNSDTATHIYTTEIWINVGDMQLGGTVTLGNHVFSAEFSTVNDCWGFSTAVLNAMIEHRNLTDPQFTP